jgi:hypothetical protein
MHVYTSKYPRLSGSSYDEVLKRARAEYHVVAQSSKRQPYVRSEYFNSSKIFLDVFWTHLMQKHPKERRKRLKFYKAALDLLRNSQISPDTIFRTDDLNIILHRFYGAYFCVQVKEDKRTSRKDFMSVFDRRPR